MKNKNLKKSTCFILLLALLLSTFTLTSFADESIAGEPYVKKIDVSDLELFIPGIPGVTSDIPLTEKGNTVSLGSSIKAKYLQKAAISIDSEEEFIPSEKDVLFVLDTSFLEGDSNRIGEIFKHTLFSREDAYIQGSSLKIKGDSFIRNNIENKIYQGVEIEGNIEYYKIDSEYHDIKSVTGEKSN